MLQILTNVIGPVFLIAAIGFLWVRRGYGFDTNQIGAIVTAIATPCMILDTLSTMQMSVSSFGGLLLIAFICHLAFMAVGFVVLKVCRLPVSAYLAPVSFGNTGNMGLPLCLFAFGNAGLSYAVSWFIVNTIMMFVVAPQCASGKANLPGLMKSPVIWALVISFYFMLTGTKLPEGIARPVHMLAQMMIPLMLLSLGVSLASLRLQSIKIGFGLACLRVFGGLAVGALLAWLMGLEGVQRGVVVLESAMPVAVFNYLFALRYKNHPGEVASMVIIATILIFLTLPVLLPFLIP